MPELQQYEHYLQRRGYSPQTMIHYLNDLGLFKTFVQISWQKVHKKNVDDFIDQQLHHGHSPKTINRRLHVIRGFYRYLSEELEEAVEIPVKQSQFIRLGRPLPKSLENREIECFFRCIEDPRDQAIFSLMLRCGLRVSEVAQLQVEQINLFAKQIRLIGKGNRERVVPLSKDTYELLKTCFKLRPKEASRFFWNKKFPTEPLQINSIQRLLKRYAQKAHLSMHCHLLRHTFARQMTESGVNRTVLRDLMGHASIASTDVYGKLSDPFVKESYFKAMQQIEKNAVIPFHKKAKL